MPQIKVEITPDEEGREACSIVWVWNQNLKEWELNSKSEHAYDAMGHQTMNSYLYWDEYAEVWRSGYKHEYAYDAMDNQTLEAKYGWDYNTQDWVGSTKWEKNFDTYHNETSVFKYQWSNNLNNWSIGSMATLTYDTSVSGENVLGIDTPSKQLTESLITLSDGAVLSQKNSTYYYSPMSNSAISQMKADGDEERIIDLFGQQVDQMTPGKVYIRGNAKVMIR